MKSCGVYKFKYKLKKLLPYCAMKGWFLRIRRVATLALPIGHFFPDHHFSCRLASRQLVVSYICISLAAAEVFLGGSEYKSCELECQFCPSRRTRVRKIINHRRRRRHRTRAVAFYPLCWPQPKSCLLIRSCPVTIYQLMKNIPCDYNMKDPCRH